MIVNLIGPPAAGKSTFAAKFVLEHPYFTFCSIDAYRVEYQDEFLAWERMMHDILAHDSVIIESCGLDWRLKKLLKRQDIRKKPILTVAFDGSPDVFEERLRERQKRPIPYKYRDEDEVQSIYWVLGHLDESPARIDKYVDASKLSKEGLYEELAQEILDFRIKNHKQGERR